MPTTVTTMAQVFPWTLAVSDSAEIPALHASRNVVVTVDRIRMTSAAIPSPAFSITTEISDSPV